jgi:methylphosphotriester-DNA--protein-cysteine methyltransferase
LSSKDDNRQSIQTLSARPESGRAGGNLEGAKFNPRAFGRRAFAYQSGESSKYQCESSERKFKQVTGVNFVDCVARTRFEKACDLLQNPDLRISEIAFAVGFQSLSQFNRVFKKLSGKSPGAYRAVRLKRRKRR